CRGCHHVEEIENPLAAPHRRQLASYVPSGKYEHIEFSHALHFKDRDSFHLDCTTCHYGVATSTNLASLDLPKMADCVSCHQVSKPIAPSLQMSNCKVCHTDRKEGPLSAVYSELVNPATHTAAFRIHHSEAAAEPGAPCFVCHLNI